MHMTMRKYRQVKGTPEDAAKWVRETLMPTLKKARGFKAYYAVAFDDGTIGSINVFEDEAAATRLISMSGNASEAARRKCCSTSKQRSGKCSTKSMPDHSGTV
jgi:hypothetical protein